MSELQPTNHEILIARALLAANSKDATTEDGQRLAALMRAHPSALTWLTDLGLSSMKSAIEKVRANPATKAILRVAVDRLREELGHADASLPERLLIDHVAISFLRMHLAERYYESVMDENPSRAEVAHWEQRLSAIQRRYLRAIETLARVRKLMGVPMVQINIAAAGGQQVVANR